MNRHGSARVFGDRLCAAMRSRGHISTGNKSGVDVVALQKEAGTTYEMARRYCEGKAIPRPEKLAKIAEWLGTTPGALLYGAGEPAVSRLIHTEVLQECLAAAQRAETLTGTTMPPDRMAKLVALLYEEAIDGRRVEDGLITRLLRYL